MLSSTLIIENITIPFFWVWKISACIFIAIIMLNLSHIFLALIFSERLKFKAHLRKKRRNIVVSSHFAYKNASIPPFFQATGFLK